MITLHGPKRACQIALLSAGKLRKFRYGCRPGAFDYFKQTPVLARKNLSQRLQRDKPDLGVIGTRLKFAPSNGDVSRTQLLTRGDADPQSLLAHCNSLWFNVAELQCVAFLTDDAGDNLLAEASGLAARRVAFSETAPSALADRTIHVVVGTWPTC
jgi:hypothetical protein